MKIIDFFDKLEDRVRGWFSHHKILYGFVGGTGIILFWRGIWHMTDYFLFESLMLNEGVDGLVSAIVGALLLLITGLFVSSFIGDEIIISGLRSEKKVAEKTEAEVRHEGRELIHLEHDVHDIKTALSKIEEKKKSGSL